MGEAFIDESTVEVAEMDEARRTRTESRDLGALRQVARRIHRFDVGRRLRDIREKSFT